MLPKVLRHALRRHPSVCSVAICSTNRALKGGKYCRFRRELHLFSFLFGIVSSLWILKDMKFDKLVNHLPIAPGDPSLCAWILETVHGSFFRNPLHFFDVGIFYPSTLTLAFSTHLLGVQPLYAFVRLFTGNVILSFNLVLILSTFLCFLTMYAYLFIRLESIAASLFGAVLFAFAIPRLAQLGHMQLVTLFYMPAALLALELFLATGNLWWRILFVTFASLQSLADYYLAYPFLIYTGIHGLCLSLPHAQRLTCFKRLAGCYAVILIVALFSWPYLIVNAWYDHRGELAESSTTRLI